MAFTASRFLDPKSDVVFKKIFGHHANLLMSFLNGVMPLSEPIVELTYLSPECELAQEAAYSRAELEDYNCYWDAIQIEVTLLEDRFEKGEAGGMAKGMARGREEGKTEVALALIADGFNDEKIARFIVSPTRCYFSTFGS